MKICILIFVLISILNVKTTLCWGDSGAPGGRGGRGGGRGGAGGAGGFDGNPGKPALSIREWWGD